MERLQIDIEIKGEDGRSLSYEELTPFALNRVRHRLIMEAQRIAKMIMEQTGIKVSE